MHDYVSVCYLISYVNWNINLWEKTTHPIIERHIISKIYTFYRKTQIHCIWIVSITAACNSNAFKKCMYYKFLCRNIQYNSNTTLSLEYWKVWTSACCEMQLQKMKKIVLIRILYAYIYIYTNNMSMYIHIHMYTYCVF